jgi:hypothetical protein
MRERHQKIKPPDAEYDTPNKVSYKFFVTHTTPQQYLYLFTLVTSRSPVRILPHGHGAFRPIFGACRR